MAKLTLNNITSGYASTAALNANNDAIEAALENTLSRDGTTPNSMSADLDMNGQSILNVASLQVAGVDISTLPADATAAANNAALAIAAADTASLAAIDADGSAALIADWSYKGNWVNTTPTYYVNNIVYVSSLGDSYICLVEHAPSAAFSTDIAKWGLLALHATATGGVGDMLKADNLQFLADYNLARSNMGLAIGTNVQAYDALLQSLAGQTTANNKVQAYSGVDTATLLDFKDEDNMASDSATALPSQQSVKAYADTKNIATQVTPSTAGNVLTSNGSTWTSTPPSSTPYTSSTPSTLSTNLIVAEAHGLGAVPRQVRVVLRCTSADGGYVANDEISVTSYEAPAYEVVAVWSNSTQVGVNITGTIRTPNKTTNGLVNLTPANWVVVIRAWL